MHPLIEMLNAKIEGKHLLKHPFYVAWSRGELTLDGLRVYARQYFAQVRAFPVYLSEMHSRSESLAYRKIIARNLAEEEGGVTTHPELWLDFATGLSVDCQSVLNSAPGPKVVAMVETFRSAARMETGLAAVALVLATSLLVWGIDRFLSLASEPERQRGTDCQLLAGARARTETPAVELERTVP